jgi:thiamine phosphate synthase YjbQ (UPF0047 family)
LQKGKCESNPLKKQKPGADRKPVLGHWQQIFHLECDIKSRRRMIIVTVSGE